MKTVFITGASSGFGNLAAKKFQKEGWNVFATMRSPEKETELNTLPNITVGRLDVTDYRNIEKAVAQCVDTYGTIDVLVNNAGYGAAGFLEEADREDIEKQFNVNFFGVVECIKAVTPQMRAQGSGVIINVTSLAGSLGMPFLSLYNASKFAVEGLTQALQFELGMFGIKVRTVAPGAFKTGFTGAMEITEGNKKEALNGYREEYRRFLEKIKKNPPKPFGYGDPQVVADLIYKCAVEEVPITNYVGKDAKMMSKLTRLLGKKQMFKTLKGAAMPKF